ncbi:MAG: 4-hydroxythreonine-4-phosphate dehydrogenase PdxA, partial [Comamonadaceae bacterium]|nr:4-hydroxythreonine-4-phosphate dehydrogenase PdxA [Comamonadaceae bacterium]
MHEKKAIAITQGDSAGIGPEIIAKAFRDQPALLQGCFVAGDLATMRRGAQAIFKDGETHLPVAVIASPDEAWEVPSRCLPVLQLPDMPAPAPWGRAC